MLVERLAATVGAMTTDEAHDRAEAAWRTMLSNCVRKLANDLDKAGRANMLVPALKIEGRRQIAEAEALRVEARKAGLA